MIASSDDRPTVGQIAEVDDPVGVCAAAIARHHHVGVGEIQMHGLSRQVLGDWCDARPRLLGRGLERGPVRRVKNVRNEFGDNVSTVTQIPLQDPVQARMAKSASARLTRPATSPRPATTVGDR